MVVILIIDIIAAILIPILSVSLQKSKQKRTISRYELEFSEPEDLGVPASTRLGVGAPRYWWNIWADEWKDEWLGIPSPSFGPGDHLVPNSKYYVTVDLAALNYRLSGTGFSRPSDGVDAIVERLRQTTRKEYSLYLVLLTDPRFFKTKPQILKEPLTIDVVKLRKFRDSGGFEKPPGFDALAALREDPEAPFFFGRRSFELETAGLEGNGSIGLSFWDLEQGRFLEEISIPFCIARSFGACDSSSQPRLSFQGAGVLDLAAEKVVDRPTAALHLVEFSPEQVFGIFARNDEQEGEQPGPYSIWKVSTDLINASVLADRLRQSQKAFGLATEDYVGIGQELEGLLFPRDQDDADAARAEFVRFVEDYAQDPPFFERDPPRLFVRTVLKGMPQPALYPVGLLNFSEDEEGFVGFHFQVESPLPKQSYAGQERCLERWRPVLPSNSATGALREAHEKIEKTGRIAVSMFGSERTYRVAGHIAPIELTMKSFREWIGERNSFESEPTVIAVVSHHNENRLYFESSSFVSAGNVFRSFQAPSAAILSGCSTGEFGASGLLGSLNGAGIDAAIATNTGISGKLAADFMTCLAEVLEESQGDIAIGRANRAAMSCLYDIKGQGSRSDEPVYGPGVLSFTLAGNPNLKFCTGGAS